MKDPANERGARTGATRKKRNNWKEPSSLERARLKTYGKNKRQCIKEGLGAEWMALWRCRRKYKVYPDSQSADKKRVGSTSRDALVRDIGKRIFDQRASFPKYILPKLFERLVEKDQIGAEECFEKMFYVMREKGMLEHFVGDKRIIRLLAQLADEEEGIRSFMCEMQQEGHGRARAGG